MKYSLAAAVLITALASPSESHATRFDLAQAPVGSERLQTPLRSRHQLDAYLRTSPQSPLHNLGPAKMKAFVNSLVFTSKGVGSYSYTDLAGLPSAEAQGILGLFGLQDDIVAGRAKRSVGAAGGRSFMKRPPPRWGKSCIVFPGGAGPRCINSPGYRCSYLCR